KGTAVIEYSVQYHPHSPLVHLFYKAGEQFITGLQITNIPCALLILSGMDIVLSARGKHIASVFNNLSVMGINVVVILDIILMVRRRDKQRVKINHLNSQFLKIIQLIHHSLKIASVKIMDIPCRRRLIPVSDLCTRLAYIDILSVFHIIGRITIAEA